MKTTTRTDEALLAELELHNTEFEALRSEILHWLSVQRQYLSLCLAAFAGGLGFAPVIVDNELYSLLLIFPFLFHVLLGEMMNSVQYIANISSYLLDTLIPRANAILDELGNARQNTIALGWEVRVNLSQFPVRTSHFALASITPTLHWAPVLAIAGLIIAFGVITRSEEYTPSTIEFLLIIANISLLIFAALRNVQLLRHFMQQTKQLQTDIPLYQNAFRLTDAGTSHIQNASKPD